MIFKIIEIFIKKIIIIQLYTFYNFSFGIYQEKR